MKIVFCLLLCLTAGTLLAPPLGAAGPAPPPWIYGQWYTHLPGEAEGEGELLMLIFLPSDILMNGQSIRDMIGSGYVVSFNQQIVDNIYTIRLEYADGFWWEESFPMPVMTTVYIDKSYGEGEYETMIYTFIPLGMAPPAPVPNDFE